MQVDTAANGTVSRQRGGGDGRVREGTPEGKPLQSVIFFSRMILQAPAQRPCPRAGGTTGRTNQPNHADL